MESKLPHLEDIYDFGEEELTQWRETIQKSLAVYIPGSNEKWERKAKLVQDLIQTELDERVSISQISAFCFKELHSKLYQEVNSEETVVSDTAETASNIHSEDSSLGETQETGSWMPRQRLGKKEYQQFIKEKLRSTQISAGVVIGSTSVPQTKAKSGRKKSTEIGKTESGRKSKGTDGKECREKTGKLGGDKRHNSVPGKLEKLTKTGKVEKRQESEEEKTTKTTEIHIEKKRDVGTTPHHSEKTVTLEKPSDEKKKRVSIESSHSSKPDSNRSASKPVLSLEEKPTFSLDTQETDEVDAPRPKESKEKETNSAGECVREKDHLKTAESSEIRPESSKEIMPKPVQDTDQEEGIDNAEEEKEETGLKYRVSDLREQASNPLFPIEEKPTKNYEHIQPMPNKGKLPDSVSSGNPEIVQDSAKKDLDFEEKPVLISVPFQTSIVSSPIEPGVIVSDSSKSTVDLEVKIDQKCEDLGRASVYEESKKLESETVLSEADSGEEVEDVPEPSISFSVGKSVITHTSDVPPVSLKPKPAKIPQEVINSVESHRNIQETFPKASAPSPVSVESHSESSHKPTQKPPIAKPPVVRKPKPLARVQSAPALDFSDMYHTLADLFNGGQEKDFDLLAAVRNALSIFRDLEDQMSAPDFEFQRSFKFALAPLEMNPRDFLKTGGHLDLDSSALKPPTEKEMYYRVVRAKQEVYDIVTRSFLKKTGWTELPHGMSLRCSWNVMWTWSKPRVDFSRLLVWQKVNHFPNSKQFSRKDYLKRNIERVAKQSAKCAQAWNITPATYLLPKEYVSFCDEFSRSSEDEGNFWIMKPVAKSRGRGITLVKDITEVAYSEPMVIQKYIKHPLLLSGFKFDLRIYVLITSLNPVEAFLYKEGFARMSTTPYTLNPEKLSNKFVHLTNSSIQKHNQNSQGDSLDQSFGGSKISLETLKQRLKFQGVDFEVIWQQVKEIIVKSLLAVQYEIENTPSCFDLVGFDVLIDSSLRAWLIEINSSPSLARDNVLDDLVKQNLVDDTLDLVQPLPFHRKNLIRVLERRAAELQKGNIGSMSQLNADVTDILDGSRPRRYGELPAKLGNYERIAPSPLLDQMQKLLTAGKCS